MFNDNGDINNAVRQFWQERGSVRGVLGGKTLDGFIHIVENIIVNSGIPDVKINTGRTSSQLPGYFRPHKSWDVVATSRGKLIAAIELKSQIGSIGNNFNNRTEEVLGSGIDLHTAIEEQAFGDDAEIFTGYIILVEDSVITQSSTTVNMKYFPVMHGFLEDERIRHDFYQRDCNGFYPAVRGVSYLQRYDLLCKRLVLKGLYTAASLIAINNQNFGQYRDISRQTSIATFLQKLQNHCNIIASYG